MKKTAILLAVLLLLTAGCSGRKAGNPEGMENDAFETDVVKETVAPTLAPEESNFRNLQWGMTLEEVITAEGAGYKTLSDTVIQYARIREEDYPADAEYEFTDNQLSCATFYIQPGYEDNNEYITTYESLIAKFTKRYGAPSSSEKSWATENLENDPSQYAAAVLSGNLVWRTGWDLHDTQIRLVLSRRNKEICIGIRYTPAA